MGNTNSTGNSDMAENADFIASRKVELDVRSTSSHSVQTNCTRHNGHHKN